MRGFKRPMSIVFQEYPLQGTDDNEDGLTQVAIKVWQQVGSVDSPNREFGTGLTRKTMRTIHRFIGPDACTKTNEVFAHMKLSSLSTTLLSYVGLLAGSLCV
jgi:hypothetical protein